MRIDIDYAHCVVLPILADAQQRRKRWIPVRPSSPCPAKDKRLDPASKTYPSSFCQSHGEGFAPRNAVTRPTAMAPRQESRELCKCRDDNACQDPGSCQQAEVHARLLGRCKHNSFAYHWATTPCRLWWGLATIHYKMSHLLQAECRTSFSRKRPMLLKKADEANHLKRRRARMPYARRLENSCP